MDDFEAELKTGFLDEALQLITEAESCFLSLETTPNDLKLIEKIFRLAHNLKGGSRAVGFEDLGTFTHQFENMLLKLKNGEMAATAPVVNLLLKCNDHLQVMINGLKGNLDAKFDSAEITAEIESALNGGLDMAPISDSETTTEPSSETDQFVPICEDTFESEGDFQELSAMTESAIAEATPVAVEAPMDASAPAPELVPVTTAPPVLVAVPKPLPTAATATPVAKDSGNGSGGAKADESVRVSLRRLEKLVDSVGEMVIMQTVLREQAQSGDSLEHLRRTVHQLGKVSKEIQDLSMGLRMVPIKPTFQKMQRIVRDISSSLGKKINLMLEGEDTEVDKTVLEALADPLVHLIRNAADHGIEDGKTRLERGKDEAGTVFLRAFHRGGKLVIEIQDDGNGLDPDRLIAKAVEKGILKPGAKLAREQALQLIFASGFSTKAQVSEISGRGVGMDVVKTNLEALRGTIQIESQVGQGTTFRVMLPLTLAIIDGLVIRTRGERFVVPLTQVAETLSVKSEEIHKVTGVGEVMVLRGEKIPVHRLGKCLGMLAQAKSDTQAAKDSANDEKIALVVRTQGDVFSVLIEDVVGQFQVVVKKLGGELAAHANRFAGSAILGDGRPALILELGECVKGLAGISGASAAPAARKGAA